MRILHVIGDSEYGGGSRVIEAVAVAARRDGHDVAVLTTCRRFQRALVTEGIEVLDRDWVRRIPDPWVDVRGVAALVQHLRRDPFDVVHTHTTRGGLLGRLAATLAGTPCVIHTAHGFAVAESDAAWKRQAYFAVERRAARWGDYLVTVSEHHRRWAETERLRPRQGLLAIPNGVADEPAALRAAPHGIPADPRRRATVLHFGRLADGKGIDVLLAAMREVHAILPPGDRPELVIAGDGPRLEPEQARARAYGLDAHVRWLGHRSDVPELLATADLVVFPSRREGLSLAVLEAMAAGRPIIATDLGGNVEALAEGACGRLVPVGDAEALSAAIVGLLADPGRARSLGQAARARYEATYPLERMVEEYLRLYERAEATSTPAERRAARRREKSPLATRR